MTKRLFSVVAFLVCAVHAADWQPLPPLPEPNGGFLSGVRNGKIVIIGGTNWEGGKKNWLSAIHEFDPAAGKWTKFRELSRPVAYGTNLQNDTTFAYLGGSDGTQSLKTLSVTEGEKTSVQLPALPASVILAAGGTVNGKHVLVGGTDDAANIAGVQCSAHAIEWTNGSWQATNLADYPGKPLAVAASAVVGSELFIFGGMNYDSAAKAPSNSVEAYAFSPEKNIWRKLQPLAVATRGLTAVTLDDQHIYLAGGYTSDFTADAVIYDVKSNTYTKAKPLPYAAMVGLVKLDGHVYCLGGEDKKQSRTDKFFRIPEAELLK
ncbi:MAG: hypothetical protein NTY98_06850 [Verrucomicrobia bacterium]|nr:hypothetical protein [Verrucomicrobiota bacterium]